MVLIGFCLVLHGSNPRRDGGNTWLPVFLQTGICKNHVHMSGNLQGITFKLHKVRRTYRCGSGGIKVADGQLHDRVNGRGWL